MTNATEAYYTDNNDVYYVSATGQVYLLGFDGYTKVQELPGSARRTACPGWR
jgi:hypothetical protein